MAKKWVIADNKVVMGHVDFHRDLVQDRKTIIGGGWWHVQDGTILLYSTSQDFGSVTLEQLKKAECHASGRHTILFSTEEDLNRALENNVPVEFTK